MTEAFRVRRAQHAKHPAVATREIQDPARAAEPSRLHAVLHDPQSVKADIEVLLDGILSQHRVAL